jgi:catechol 2,3-dioxygenase-like lactoylglutathione lyase family enzyme
MGLNDYPVGVLLAVSDLDRARRFYEGQLQLVPTHEEGEEEGILYNCADGTSIFVYLSPANAGRSPATCGGWRVDDLQQVIAQLTAQGVTFEQYDQPGITTDARGVFDGGRFRAAWFKDPDGNTLSITQLTG